MEKKKPAKKEKALHGLQAAGDNAETPAQHPGAANGAFWDETYPVIGIGASAGGLEAIEEFFHSVPDDSGMAFVVVSHTDPGRASLLPDIIRRKINMPVILVEDGMGVEPNTVYLPPSNRDLILEEKVFRLKEQQRGSKPRLPIDTFLKSLAGSRGERAGCIILSGTGSDGTHGLRFVKESGGVTMAQSPDSARYEGMPESAIGTGMADHVLRPSEMPKQLIEYFSHDINLSRHREIEPPDDFLSVVSKIVITISNHTGHDFSQYKKNTLVRRIQRRMSITHTENPEKYLSFLHRNPAEIEALFQDLLIGVTSFFRDPEAFNFLKNEILPDLLARKDENLPFRVWIPGCATGEEVYSIVMLLQEVQEDLNI
ncbi:MAG: chemotaxis protein CheB, partial [Desulfosalsimonadaceae bacterium]|nr:chemotaxis protein CheB [Desulfosalsimonadaceae bacterium]